MRQSTPRVSRRESSQKCSSLRLALLQGQGLPPACAGQLSLVEASSAQCISTHSPLNQVTLNEFLPFSAVFQKIVSRMSLSFLS